MYEDSGGRGDREERRAAGRWTISYSNEFEANPFRPHLDDNLRLAFGPLLMIARDDADISAASG